MPLDFADAPLEKRQAITRLYFDVDDTFTTNGLLTLEAVGALHDAADSGLSLVAVTGRSTAWAELLFRFFPLTAVVAETGAVYLTRREGRLVLVHHEPDKDIRARHQDKRERATKEVLAQVPAARLALDNLGRLADVAFDLIEDGPALDAPTTMQIRQILKKHGLQVMQSSVHINAFCGGFTKESMVRRYLQDEEAIPLEEAAPSMVYVGDSTNDGDLFQAIPLSVGVANVDPHLPTLIKRGQAPKYRVGQKGGAGFAQVVRLILSARPNYSEAERLRNRRPEKMSSS
jgi:HAD superfamily hydrolase (TIGR01484 family)